MNERISSFFLIWILIRYYIAGYLFTYEYMYSKNTVTIRGSINNQHHEVFQKLITQQTSLELTHREYQYNL